MHVCAPMYVRTPQACGWVSLSDGRGGGGGGWMMQEERSHVRARSDFASWLLEDVGTPDSPATRASCTRLLSCTRTHACMHPPTHKHVCTRALAHVHSLTHARTFAHKQAHTD
jgi:hypothetical protein